MWEWFTTKPFVDAGECRFVRLLITRALRFDELIRDFLSFRALELGYVDRQGADAVAVVADRSTPHTRDTG